MYDEKAHPSYISDEIAQMYDCLSKRSYISAVRCQVSLAKDGIERKYALHRKLVDFVEEFPLG